MLVKLLRRLAEPRREVTTRLVSAMLLRGEATGRDLLARLRAAGQPLSAARFRELMGNLMDSGLVRVHVPRRPVGPGRRGKLRRYALAVALRPPSRDGR